METQIFSDFGLVGGAFILMLGTILYYVPKAFQAHFDMVDKLVTKFSVNLERITDKNTNIAEGFIGQLGKITAEHEAQNNKLNAIHDDIKILKK